MNRFFLYLGIALLLASCQAKPEQTDDSQMSAMNTSLTDVQLSEKSAVNQKKSTVKSIGDSLTAEVDSLELEEGNDLECYVWSNTYLATTIVEDEEGDQFELYVAISLNDYEKNDYTGTIHIYLSGCEEQMYKGKVTAKAQHNFVTVYFDENVDGMEEMFKKGDKLVKFEISYGEYIASWFAPMNDFVDEYTVLSLQK